MTIGLQLEISHRTRQVGGQIHKPELLASDLSFAMNISIFLT